MSDFIDVDQGIAVAYFWWPVAPCAAANGSGFELGVPPFSLSGLANATNNYWGSSQGPSTSVDLLDILAARAMFEKRFQEVIAAIPLGDQLLDTLLNAHGQLDQGVTELAVGEGAKVSLDVQSCFIPVVEIPFPTIVRPVDYSDWLSEPIHSTSSL